MSQPRCPKCRWHLQFLPYSVAHETELNVWEGHCWNPNCDYCSVRSVGGFRVVTPRDALFTDHDQVAA